MKPILKEDTLTAKVNDFIDDGEMLFIEDEAIVDQFRIASNKLKNYTEEYQVASLASKPKIKPEEFCGQIVECLRMINDTLYDFSKYHKVQI